VDVKKITVIPGGVDIKEVRNIQPYDEKYDILFAGRLIKEKNVDVLLKAVEKVRKVMPSIRCHIIGGGPEKEPLNRLAAQLQLRENVSFSGFLDYHEVISRIKSSKVLVVPSVREGFGIVVIEAYACAVPVITVKTGQNAATELVDGTGFAVNLDPEELSEAILTIIKDPGMHEKMSGSALNKAQMYDWDKIVKQLSDLYEEIIFEHKVERFHRNK
jgi:glycosyltransferase involved in cell wall biosynthesis